MDEKFHEQAAALDQSRRDDALHAAQRTLQGKGQAHCEDCTEPIPRERRKATPSVTRCIACKTIF